MDQALPSTDALTQARQERERLRLADMQAHEVLARVAGQTPTTGRTAPSLHPDVGNAVLPLLLISITVGAGGDDVRWRVPLAISPAKQMLGR